MKTLPQRGVVVRWSVRISFCIALLSLVPFTLAQSAARERISINADWRFTREDPADTGSKLAYETIKPWVLSNGEAFLKEPKNARPAGELGADVAYTKADFNDSSWRKLSLPHDFAIEGPFAMELNGNTGKLPYFGVAWYRKTLEIPAADAGKQIYLDVDGAMSYANVWCNGQYAGGWPYGYSSFRVDLTPYIKPGGANSIAIRLDNPNNSSRFYCGGGIYRNVWLVKTSPVHVGQYGTYITTPEVSAASGSVDLKVTVDNNSKTEANVSIQTQLFALGADGKPSGAAVATIAPATLKIAPGKSETAATKATVANPKLWSVKNPNRYIAVTTVQQDGKAVDTYETKFGIRTIKFDPLNGFILNGEHMPLQGVCNHSDLGALGMAINVRALERQLEILRTMGCNAIRTSHNFPAPELLELCDKMGFVVIDEAFDTWVAQKNDNDYHLLFPDWSEKDLRSNIRRDRNHPSVIVWSTGNEVAEVGRGASPTSIRLTQIATEEDPTRPTNVAAHNYGAGYNGFQTTIGVFGYNYLRGQGPNGAENTAMYKEFRAANPNIFIMSTESASTLSSRGVYVFPFTDVKGGGYADNQMSSYDLYAPTWASTPDMEWKAEDSAGFVVGGEFVWTGFDYLGEPTVTGGGGGGPRGARGAAAASGPATAPVARGTPAPAGGARRGGNPAAQNPRRSSYFGIIDLAGFPKDRYYLYQSRWRADLPMAHILPHWNWEDRMGEVTPVHVYTSGDEGELFLNGKSLGKKKKGEYEYRLRWDDVKYEPGELKVVTYKAGKEWATANMKTTGAASKLTLKPDRATITADGQDLSFITVSVADKDGAMVPRSMNTLKFEITGPGEIIAVDNGDASSLVSFQSTEMKAFNGLCLVVVRSKPGQAGTITVRATSDGLQAGEAPITTAAK